MNESRLPSERVAFLQSALERLNNVFPAVACAIVDEQGIIYSGASGRVARCGVGNETVGDDASGTHPVGKADYHASASVAASPTDTVFPVASISKTIVAGLCLQCVERGELILDQDINTYLCRFGQPEDEDCKIFNPNFPDASITSRHLLQHRSGLCDDETALCWGSVWRSEEGDCPVTLQEYVKRRFRPESEANELFMWSATHKPGDAPWHYSNAGFAILGLALERATGFGGCHGGLDQLARDRIFGPLSMSRSSFFLKPLLDMQEDKIREDVVIAAPHGAIGGIGGSAEPEVDGQSIGAHHYGVCEYPAAGLRSTAQDLAQWLFAVISPSINNIISDTSLAQMLPSGRVCKNGLGWWGSDARYGNQKGSTWEHGGFMDGVRSHIYVWPRWRVGAVLMGNGEGGYQSLVFEIKAALAEHLGIQLKMLDELEVVEQH